MKPYEQMSKEEKLILLEQETPDDGILSVMARDFDEDVRLFLAEYLCDVHTDLSEQLLLHLMEDSAVQIRIAACDSACWCRSETIFLKLIKKSICDSFLVRGYAVLSAADVLRNRNVQTELRRGMEILLRNCCKEKSIWVRMCYAQSLYRLGDSDALCKLISYLNAKRYNYRCCAVNLLMDIVSENNCGIILQALEKQKETESNPMLQEKLDSCISKIHNFGYCI